MNRDETIALFERCEAARAAAGKAALAEGKSETQAREIAHEAAKAVWNGWAEPLLAERKAMEAGGRWAAEKDSRGVLEPKNEATRQWMETALVDFSYCLFLVRGFEGDKETAIEADKESATASPPVNKLPLEDTAVRFDGFIFPDYAIYRSASFRGPACFDSASFTGPAYFGSASFSGDISFRSASFTGPAIFQSVSFTGPAFFERANFTGNAFFGSANFNGDASFDSASFNTDASFDSANFSGDASFQSASFTSPAIFQSVSFTGPAFFDRASFTGDTFFGSASFNGDASFDNASFGGDASFRSASFSSDASFGDASFSGNAFFHSASFSGNAFFHSASFTGDAFFGSASFHQTAGFVLTKFEQYADFEAAQFFGPANFNAMRIDRAFSLAQAHFEHVPDFIQASFGEAPRLDHVTLDDQLARSRSKESCLGAWRIYAQQRRKRSAVLSDKELSEARNLTSKFRALKGLAIKAHDGEREHLFHKGEMRARRISDDEGRSAFLLSVLYDIFSDFGRSFVRPLGVWLALIAFFALLHVGSSVVLAANNGCSRPFTFWSACYLSIKKGLVVLGGFNDERVRDAYRCLYEQNPLPANVPPDPNTPAADSLLASVLYIPWWITAAEFIQTLLSVVLIFLMALALRNQFKIK